MMKRSAKHATLQRATLKKTGRRAEESRTQNTERPPTPAAGAGGGPPPPPSPTASSAV